ARPGAAMSAATAKAEAVGALEARLPLGVDLATVERLALLGIAEDLIGRVQFREAILGLGIVAILVGVMPLGEPPVGLLDVGFRSRRRYAQNVIRIAHAAKVAPGSRSCNMPGVRSTRLH